MPYLQSWASGSDSSGVWLRPGRPKDALACHLPGRVVAQWEIRCHILLDSRQTHRPRRPFVHFALHPAKHIGPSDNVPGESGNCVDSSPQSDLVTKAPIAVGSGQLIQGAKHGIGGYRRHRSQSLSTAYVIVLDEHDAPPDQNRTDCSVRSGTCCGSSDRPRSDDSRSPARCGDPHDSLEPPPTSGGFPRPTA